MSTWFNYDATAKILVFGLLVGAALPAMFAFGVRLHAAGATPAGDGQLTTRRRLTMTTLAWVVYLLALVSVIVGVLFIARDFIGHHIGWYILGAKPG